MVGTGSLIHSEPWGFWEPTGQLVRMHGSQGT